MNWISIIIDWILVGWRLLYFHCYTRSILLGSMEDVVKHKSKAPHIDVN